MLKSERKLSFQSKKAVPIYIISKLLAFKTLDPLHFHNPPIIISFKKICVGPYIPHFKAIFLDIYITHTIMEEKERKKKKEKRRKNNSDKLFSPLTIQLFPFWFSLIFPQNLLYFVRKPRCKLQKPHLKYHGI